MSTRTCEYCLVVQNLDDTRWSVARSSGTKPFRLACPPCAARYPLCQEEWVERPAIVMPARLLEPLFGGQAPGRFLESATVNNVPVGYPYSPLEAPREIP